MGLEQSPISLSFALICEGPISPSVFLKGRGTVTDERTCDAEVPLRDLSEALLFGTVRGKTRSAN